MAAQSAERGLRRLRWALSAAKADPPRNRSLLIPLVNWTNQAVQELQLPAWIPSPKKSAVLASGNPVSVEQLGHDTIYTFDLDIADTLILR